MEVDGGLLIRCLKLPNKDPPIIGYARPVFVHALSISIDNYSELASISSRNVPIEVDVRDGSLEVLAPRTVSATLNPRKKRRIAQPMPKPVVVSIPISGSLSLNDALDFALASELRRNRAITTSGLAVVRGPDLIWNGTDAVTLETAVGINANVGPLSPTRLGQGAMTKLMARALDDPTLADPDPYQASPADLLRVLTRAPRRDAPTVQPPGLLTPLLPFQRESVQWCLRREGKDLMEGGSKVTDLDRHIRDYVITPPLGWRQMPQDSNLWINPYSLETLDHEPQPEKAAAVAAASLTGEYGGAGLLAEEMGLGKTLEMIALILLNPRPESSLAMANSRAIANTTNGASKSEINTDLDFLNNPTQEGNPSTPSSLSPTKPHPIFAFGSQSQQPSRLRPLQPVKATLVIMPPVILTQWHNEVSSHAPHLKVVIYEGRGRGVGLSELASADVVLVSYSVVSAEVHSATFNPGKHNTRFWHLRTDIEAARSPLVQVQFWRVILDEVQMIHTGISNAAKVARIVPRVHAWGVTGTPVKTSIKDLRGLLLFLDVEPFVETVCWQRMIASPVDFAATMSRIGLRHTKPLVASQLHLPPQHRILVPLRLSEIERHHYDQLYHRFRDSANPNRHSWLVRLRQACCHASLSHKDPATPIMTVEQVLARLVDDADGAVWVKLRQRMVLQLELGQLLDKAGRVTDALSLWQELGAELETHIAAAKARVARRSADAAARRRILEASLASEQAAIETGENGSHSVDMKQDSSVKSEGDIGDELLQPVNKLTDNAMKMNNNGKAISTVLNSVDNTDVKPKTESTIRRGSSKGPTDSGEETEDEGITKREETVEPEYAEYALGMALSRLVGSRNRLRSLQELLHRTYFFTGTGYFRLNERLGDAATEHNSELEAKFYDLAEQLRQELLEEAADRVEQLATKVRQPRLVSVPSASTPHATALRDTANFIRELSSKLLKILRKPLLDKKAVEAAAAAAASADSKDNQMPPDAYAESLDDQEYAYVYIDILQLALKDRQVLIMGGSTPPPPPPGADKDEGESELRMELMLRRSDIMPALGGGIEPVLSWARKVPELTPLVHHLRDEIRDWQRELGALRDLFNGRLEYYKQLQTLSDRVVDIETPADADVRKLVQDKRAAVHRAERATAHFEAKLRYVRELEVTTAPELRQEGQSRGGMGSASDIAGECPICQETYELGSLTACGHRFCTRCITKWWEIRGSCPLCKRKIGPQDMIQFRTRPVKRGSGTNWGVPVLSSEIYTPVANTVYNEIAREPLEQSYGIKVDMIVRHVKWLRAQDDTAQIVVFSQWAQMLKMLSTALTENGLRAAGIADGPASFRTDPGIACFLLHAKSDAAGLTLVNACHVVLCEPLLNTALELQAISRIHRIGQTRETTVWLFCVEDTVEQAILALTTRRRVRQLADLRQYHDGTEAEDADSSILASSTGTKLVDKASGSEVVADDDLDEVLAPPQTPSDSALDEARRVESTPGEPTGVAS